MLAPVARFGEPVVGVAVHPAVGRVVVAQRKVVGLVSERLAHGDALGVERVGDAPDRGLRALLVDVPALEVLQGSRVHQDERRMDDRARVHERRGERVLDRLDRGVGPADHLEGVRGVPGGKGAGGQAPGAHGDRDLRGSVLAREIGQGAGLGERDLGGAARIAEYFRHRVTAEGPRRQEHHLTVAGVGCDCARDVGLGERGRGDEEKVSALHRRADVGRRERDAHLAAPRGILEDDRAPLDEGRERPRIAAPQPYLMVLLGEVGGGGIAAVAAAQNGDPHGHAPSPPSPRSARSPCPSARLPRA